jgi:hypothetical protein
MMILYPRKVSFVRLCKCVHGKLVMVLSEKLQSNCMLGLHCMVLDTSIVIKLASFCDVYD